MKISDIRKVRNLIDSRYHAASIKKELLRVIEEPQWTTIPDSALAYVPKDIAAKMIIPYIEKQIKEYEIKLKELNTKIDVPPDEIIL